MAERQAVTKSLIVYDPDVPTADQLAQLEAAWASAQKQVPLATSQVTALRPYPSSQLRGEYHWNGRGLAAVDIGIPGWGEPGADIAAEHEPVFKRLGHVYHPAAVRPPRGRIDRFVEGVKQRHAAPEREWPVWLPGTRNLEAFLIHERAHGQMYEAGVLLDSFPMRVKDALAIEFGVTTIDRQPLQRVTSRKEGKAQELNEAAQVELRRSVADELGLYASTLPTFADTWDELWPSAIAAIAMQPNSTGRVLDTLRPFVEEIASIPEATRQNYLYSRLNTSQMSEAEVEFIEEHRSDLLAARRAQSLPRSMQTRDLSVNIDIDPGISLL